MAFKSKLISISYFEDLETDWLDYEKSFYKNTNNNALIHTDLISCETSSKSFDLISCFKIEDMFDFNNHIIRNNINWETIKWFDSKYNNNLEIKLKKLIPKNAIIMFLPEN